MAENDYATDEQSRARFSALCRDKLGVSAERFLDDWDAGEYDEVELDEVPGLLRVVAAIPMVRPRGGIR